MPKTAAAAKDRILKDWRTTTGALLGIAIFLAGYFDIPVLQIQEWGEITGIIIASVTGVFAKDKDTTSPRIYRGS